MLREKLLKARGKISFCGKHVFQKLKHFNFKKQNKFFSLFLLLIIFGLVLPRGFVQADLAGIILDHTIFPVLYIVFAILLWVGFIITSIAAYTLNATLNPAIMNQVFANPAIYQGWTIIRDICNLLFLLLMLLVAFGTIVQSQKYNIKNSLPKLILAIFLINFSNVIAGAIIDFGNILMYGILGWMCAIPDSCFSDYMGGLMKVAWNFADTYSLFKLLSWDGINSTQVIGAAVAMVYLFMYGFILLALAAFLMVRTAGLALLLILAPFAYFGEVMPGMEKIASKWWNNIWSYALFGPIFALMLYIAGELAQITIAVPPITDPNLGWYSGTIVIIISNILPLLFLLAIIPVTKELGLAGTDVIMKNTTGLGEKIGVGAAKYAGGATDRWLARGAQDQRTGLRGSLNRARAYLSPTVWKRAHKASQAEKEHDYDIAAGRMREKVFERGTAVEHGEDARQREVARHQADVKGKNKDELAHLMQEALKKGMIERAEGISRELASTSDMNEVYTKVRDKTGEFYENTADGFVKFMEENFEPKLGEDKTGRLMADLAQLEKKDGHHSLKGTSKFNTATGKFEIVRDHNAREKKAAEEFGTVESQGKWKNMDSRTLLDEAHIKDDTGKTKYKDDGTPETKWKWGDRGRYILDDMTEEDLKNAWKGKAKHQKRLLGVLEDNEQMATLTPKQRVKANKLRNELMEAVYGKPEKKKYKGGGMGVGQVEGQEPQGERESQEEHAREEEEEEERKRRGPKPISGGAVSKEDFIKETFADIGTEAKNIQSAKTSPSEKKAAYDALYSKYEEALNSVNNIATKDIEDIVNREKSAAANAMADADKNISKEFNIKPVKSVGKSVAKEIDASQEMNKSTNAEKKIIDSIKEKAKKAGKK